MHSYSGEGLGGVPAFRSAEQEQKIRNGQPEIINKIEVKTMKKKKSIFITGAASGIGRSTAILFAGKGWFTGLFDLNTDGLKEVQDEIGIENSCIKKMDVTDPKSVVEAVHYFSGFTGDEMNVLFNCAGTIKMGPHMNIPLNEQKVIVDVNINGILNCIDLSFNLLKKTAGARIINMASASSLMGTPHMAVYSATKAAISSLTESLNIEFEEKDIFVSDIRVPYVKTPLLEQDVTVPGADKLGVKLTPEYVAGLVWKAAFNKKVHNDGKGMFRLKILIKFPRFVKKPLIKLLLMS